LPPSLAGSATCPHPVGPTCHPASLTPASGRQDHTILPYAKRLSSACSPIAHRLVTRPAIASRAKRQRVHRIPPRVRDDRDTPLMWDETAAGIEVIWGWAEQEYFCRGGLDTHGLIVIAAETNVFAQSEMAIRQRRFPPAHEYFDLARLAGEWPHPFCQASIAVYMRDNRYHDNRHD
jgi:hypothetical protein